MIRVLVLAALFAQGPGTKKAPKAAPAPAPAAKEAKEPTPPAAPAAPTPAPAQTGAGEAAAAAPTPKGKAPKVKVYTFGALDVEGKLRTPQLLYFLNRMKLELDSSMPDKRSFMKELERTADDKDL